ncbi:hypothetical protein LC55x_4285 [Lysobacter capsici]|nr:hypothetical protein LC55x_4285 [Lysobacter capsici]
MVSPQAAGRALTCVGDISQIAAIGRVFCGMGFSADAFDPVGAADRANPPSRCAN